MYSIPYILSPQNASKNAHKFNKINRFNKIIKDSVSYQDKNLKIIIGKTKSTLSLKTMKVLSKQ